MNHAGLNPIERITAMLLVVLVFASAVEFVSNCDGASAPHGWSLPLTAERIAQLPEAQQVVWKQYLERSDETWKKFQEAEKKELKEAGLSETTLAPQGEGWGVPKENDKWFAGGEGRKVTAVVLSYQTPYGGWCKAVDMSGNIRPKGGSYQTERGKSWHTTIDNGASYTQTRFLARAWLATGNAEAAEGARRGLRFLAQMQYPNGGWPQVYPLAGSYHDAVTFNDDAMLGVLRVFFAAATGAAEYGFLSEAERKEFAQSYQRGVRCLLDSQVRVDGRPTAWGQQCDPITLKPCGARAFEPVCLSSGESAGLAVFLMELPKPSAEIVAAIEGAEVWFRKTEIKGYSQAKKEGKKQLVPTEGSSVWPRYSELGSDKPIFGDRDYSVHYELSEISPERQNGYAWYGGWGKKVFAAYAAWKKKN